MCAHDPLSSSAPAREAIDLKILATTDLHMNVLGYDYFANRPGAGFGLSRVATAIAAERQGHGNTLLFDNGDALQGSPMGDFAAEAPRHSLPRHPAIAAMNALDYDAATLGNHDFSFGLPFLRRTLQGAGFPFVSTNLASRRPLPVLGELLLPRAFRDRGGRVHHLQVGVLGFLPPQTVTWEPALQDEIAIEDIIEAARRGAAALRARGADLVVALSHSGIGPRAHAPMMENASTALADLPGIDVVIAGHTHRVFPCESHPSGPGIEAARGTVSGKPCVMPGFWGSHLGVIELSLAPAPDGGWSVGAFRSRNVEVGRAPEDNRIDRIARGAHQGTLQHFGRRIGRSSVPLNSYLTLLGQDSGLRLVAMAQRWHVRKMLAGSRWAGLPIVSAAAPFRAGGRSGPAHYTDVPSGRLTLRQLADLYLFPNRVCALLVTGADLADWLERSSSIFRRITPGLADQDLTDPDFPSYNFDLIDGLEWQIDLTLPPRHAPDGRVIHPESRRVCNLRHRGRPVLPEAQFILVTNSYRLSDSGVFAGIGARAPVLLRGETRTREILRRYVARCRTVEPAGHLGWHFRPMPGTSVRIETGPGASPHLSALPYAVEDLGIGPNGFRDLRLHL